MKAWFSKYWLLIVLPVIYVTIISSQLNSRISPNNHNLIITLTTVENWIEEGIFHHQFNLVHSWGEPGDKGVHYYPRVISEEGRNYFVSYPPLSYIVFYLFAVITGGGALVLKFKLFGVLLHVLTFWGLWKLLRDRFEENNAMLISAVYLFFPAAMVLSVMYYPEQLILLLMLWLLHLLHKEGSETKIWVLTLLGFLLVYCDWLGGLVVFGVVLASLRYPLMGSKSMFMFATGAVFAGALILFQYSLIDGVDGLYQGLKVRLLERSGVFPEAYSDRGVNLYSSNSFKYIFEHLGLTMIGMLLIGLILRPNWGNRAFNSWFYVVFIPIGLHMILLFNSNILHFQNLAKVGLLGISVFVILKTNKELNLTSSIFTLVALIAVGGWITQRYFKSYPPQNEIYEKAEFINANKKPEATIVMIQDAYSEDLVLLSYLTKRNVVWSEEIGEIPFGQQSIWINWKERSTGTK